MLQVFGRSGGSGSAVSWLRSYGVSDGCVGAYVCDGDSGVRSECRRWRDRYSNFDPQERSHPARLPRR